jgi:hypothetical protein
MLFSNQNCPENHQEPDKSQPPAQFPGTGTARLVLQPWRNLRVSGAVHNNAVAELHFTVTPKNAQEKVRIAIGYRMVTK